jgi:fatty-acyl-CoA synthase
MGNVVTCGMGKHPVYLWTLPMFHCNGWCFPWTISIVAGTHVCLRRCAPSRCTTRIAEHGVTHLCGAPIVMSTLLNAPEARRSAAAEGAVLHRRRAAARGGARRHEGAGFDVTHLYGLTETYGPAVVNDWHARLGRAAAAEQAQKKARQGVRYAARSRRST